MRGERRIPLTGVGRAHDSERWFRFYMTDFMADLLFLSKEAALLYLDLTHRAYFNLGDLNADRHLGKTRWFGKARARKAFAELEAYGFARIKDGQIIVKSYDPRNHGFAIRRPPIPPEVRDAVYMRDGHACVYCGSEDDLTLDHLIPISDRGADTPKNLVTACLGCNLRKRASDPRDWGRRDG